MATVARARCLRSRTRCPSQVLVELPVPSSLRFAALLTAGLLASATLTPAQPAPAFPQFRAQEIETNLGVGYAVLLVDVDHDGKRDIVVVDTNRVIWYANPDWKMRAIIQGGTKPDNVCIDADDIDGDGKLDFALVAD